MKVYNKTVQTYARGKKQKQKCPTEPAEKDTTTVINVCNMDTTQATCKCQKHAPGKMWDTRRSPRKETQWGYHRTTRPVYGRKYE